MSTSSGWQEEFPFEPRFADLAAGRMHYVDEGRGDPVLLLHGNPTWSYLYRKFIEPLSRTHRVLVPDHLGFGRSELPPEAPYTLAWHIANLTEFVLRLDLKNVTLAVHDWGGPIGLGFATEHVGRVRRLVVFNSWAFRVPSGARIHPLLEAARLPGTGERLILEENALVERGIPGGMHRTDRLTEALMEAYRSPFREPVSRRPILALIREIPVGRDTPSASIIERIQDRLRTLPAEVLVIWGERDPVFPKGLVALWKARFPAARVEMLPEASHFLQEDAPEQVLDLLQSFLRP